jgi:diaminopimelate decarboxylase
MSGFERDASGRALLAGRPILELCAEAGVTTPAYVYDVGAVRGALRDLRAAFGSQPGLIAYAVKANTAGSIVRAVAEEGGGADVVSDGELEVALACGIPPDRIVMSGVAKTDAEIDRAIAASILAIQLESVEEIARVAARARALGRCARVALRVNPAVEIDSHAHVATGHDEAKFGIVQNDIPGAWERIDAEGEALAAVGVSTHVGSMLATPEPYLESARVVLQVARARRAAGGKLEYVDFGGGFAVDYGPGPVTPPAEMTRAALRLLANEGFADLALLVEPGRALVAPYGVLVASVVQQKRSGVRQWCMIDAGMNDLVRPALYGAHHRIEPADRLVGGPDWHVVGPVCESADDFGFHPLGEPLPAAVVIRDAGAYGFTMASEYNGRPLPAELFCEDGRVVSVRVSPGVEAWVKSRLGA